MLLIRLNVFLCALINQIIMNRFCSFAIGRSCYKDIIFIHMSIEQQVNGKQEMNMKENILVIEVGAVVGR